MFSRGWKNLENPCFDLNLLFILYYESVKVCDGFTCFYFLFLYKLDRVRCNISDRLPSPLSTIAQVKSLNFGDFGSYKTTSCDMAILRKFHFDSRPDNFSK